MYCGRPYYCTSPRLAQPPPCTFKVARRCRAASTAWCAPETTVTRRRHRSCASRTLRTSPKKRESTRRTHKIFGFREEPITSDARFSRRLTRHTRPPRFSSSRLLSRSGTIISARGNDASQRFGGQVRSLLQDGRRRHRCLCRLGRRGSVVALCCAPQGRVSQRSNGGGPGGGRTWGACCPVDAVGGPYASRRCQQRSPLYALGLSGPALLRPVPADPVLALWA